MQNTDAQKRLESHELGPALRDKIAALSPEDLSIIVLAASQALGELDSSEALAEECSMSVKELSSWETRVFYDGLDVPEEDQDDETSEQDDLVTIALRLRLQLKTAP